MLPSFIEFIITIFRTKKNLIFPRCNVAITSCYHHIVWQLGMFTLKFSFQRVSQQLLNTIMHEKNTICYCRSTPLIAVALQDKCKHFLGFKLAVVGDWQVKKIKSFDCRTISVYIFFFDNEYLKKLKVRRAFIIYIYICYKIP